IGGAGAFAITQPVVAAPDLDHAERFHDGIVKPLGGGNVGDGYRNVVEHKNDLRMIRHSESVMPGLVPGIHVLGCSTEERRGWPGHPARRRASRFCPGMTKVNHSFAT